LKINRYLFILILPLFQLFGGEEFILSYRLVVQEGIVLNEEFSLSKAMTKKGADSSILEWCEIDPGNSEADTLYTLIKKNKEELLECLFAKGVVLEGYGDLKGYVSKETTILKIAPLRLVVDFKGQFVMIGIVRERNISEIPR